LNASAPEEPLNAPEAAGVYPWYRKEYLLVDRDTRDLAPNPPRDIVKRCGDLLNGQVNLEFLKSQIEVETRVSKNVREAGEDLRHLRKTVAAVAAEDNLAPIAVPTHPFAKWTRQKHTEQERYDVLARDFAGVGRRLVICGMHVHVGIEDEDLRIDLMNQMTYFLPHLLALSTSSPFWTGEDMGMMSYRLAVWDSLPRTGLPDRFDSWGEYQRLVAQIVNAGLIEDGTKIWWDIRPSARYPTLEMRIADMCTRLDDALSIAALYQCLLSMLYRLRATNQRWRIYPPSLIQENRWRAQRYGVYGGLVDFGLGEVVPFPDLLEELLNLVAEDAEMLDWELEIENTREIALRGTSAHRQLALYNEAIKSGADKQEALVQVVDALIIETVSGV
jgi:carboxylate-amine ligase